MTLSLYFHPLSSFCWKALIGLYEVDLAFEKHVVDLSNESERAAFLRLWPIGKFPVLRDASADRVVPESTIVLEYVDQLRPGVLLPKDPATALECRLKDRIYDTCIHLPMQAIVGDRLRPVDKRDPLGVERARSQIEAAYDLVESQMGSGTWSVGERFTMADCSAMPALFYADKVVPLGTRWPNVVAYLERLTRRPSVARVLDEAKPYFAMFPQ
jgi:glutathione S-transferase